MLRKRWTVRAFKPTPIPDEKLWKLLKNAVKTPSAGHKQPAEFIIVKDPKTKKALAEAAWGQMFVVEPPVVIVVCANTRRPGERYGRRGVEFYSLIDTAFTAHNIQLSAFNEELGSFFIAAFADGEVSKIMGLSDHVRPVGIMGIGLPDEPPQRYPRLPLHQIIHYERWGRRTESFPPSG